MSDGNGVSDGVSDGVSGSGSVAAGAEDNRIAIVPLTRDLDRETFDCGVAAMNEFLRLYALQNEENRLSRTRVAVPVGGDLRRIAGFYTTSWTTVQFSEVPERGLPKRYPFQVGLLAQLAVDQSRQGHGLGGVLLLDALARFELLDRINPIPAVVLDLREEALRPFYARYGFVACGQSAPNRMYIMMKTIVKMALNE